jgi:hypothetical protein
MMVRRVRSIAAFALLAAFALTSCGGGSGPSAVVTPQPTPAPQDFSGIGYALASGGRSQPRMLNEYPSASTAALRTFTELGGGSIRFDANGNLWSDNIGWFTGYRPDGSSAGQIMLSGSLLSFDARGTLYVASVRSVDVYAVGANDATTLLRSIITSDFPCTAAADAAGNLYVATCLNDPSGTVYGNVSVYTPSADGPVASMVTNAVARGPLTVAPSGDVYAVYNGSIGVWNAGTFGAGVPNRMLPVAASDRIMDVAADRNGNLYAVTRPSSGGFGATRALLYFAAGSATATILQSGALGAVATPPR